ncbi:gustatory receptor for sugar taste 64f-like [Galleria mellonella]|uniref:Gustatory receptor n=1 Tax=Galleria mellonella TaxID=7137 RepID=A0A6J1X990_GALME|nr:gustatory receptor for sugar taste 64f-like [Galleria mellonella]
MIVLKRKEVTIIQLENKEMRKKHVRKNMSAWMSPHTNRVHVKKKTWRTPATFQKSLKVTLVMGQIFSLLPVVGICSDDPMNVRFVYTSWKCFYSTFSILGQIYMALMCVYNFSLFLTSLNNVAPLIFYTTSCITMIMFYDAARAWPTLVQHIAHTELIDPNYDKKLTIKCNITCAVVLTLALLEHTLSLLSKFAAASVCYPDESVYEGFIKHSFPSIFQVLPYSTALGVLTQFLHFQSTFIWNFSDLFVICMSYYLTSRLEHVNERLLEAQGKYLPETFWRTTREDYCRATKLVRKVDDVISGIVFMSFANNLIFVCLQLFNTLEDGIKGKGECSSRTKGTPLLGGYEAAIYFVFSLIFLISRSVAVSLIAAQVNTASEVPVPVLYDVPSPAYCVEVQRFIDQVNGDNVALSGLKFFSVTRSLLLSVAGTIVTYELVMFQFNSPSTTSTTSTVQPNTTTIAP